MLPGKSFSDVDMDQEGEEGDEECDSDDDEDDAHDNATNSPPVPIRVTEGQGTTRKQAPAFKNTSKTLWRPIIPRMRVSGNQQQPTLRTL